MPRRIAHGVAAGCALALSVSQLAAAGEGDGTRTGAGSNPDLGEVAALAGLDTTGGAQAAGAPASRPRCSWEVYMDLQERFAADSSMGVPASPMRREGGTILPSGSAASQSTETLYKRTCVGVAGFTLSWVPDGVNVEDLISSALHRVRAQIPTPAMNMNPDPSVGGIVNIGLWLAVQDPGQVSITASVGPVWATVTARYERTVWELGNGDVVECAGVGTPIVDWDTVEQGPCGYTYRWPSAPKFTGTDDLAYHASVTGHWVITYATSSGGSGSLAPIARTSEFTYQVREIQTVRVPADG